MSMDRDPDPDPNAKLELIFIKLGPSTSINVSMDKFSSLWLGVLMGKAWISNFGPLNVYSGVGLSSGKPEGQTEQVMTVI